MPLILLILLTGRSVAFGIEHEVRSLDRIDAWCSYRLTADGTALVHPKTDAAEIQRRLDAAVVVGDLDRELVDLRTRMKGGRGSTDEVALGLAFPFVDFVSPLRRVISRGDQKEADVHARIAALHHSVSPEVRSPNRITRDLDEASLRLTLHHDDPARLVAILKNLVTGLRPLRQFKLGDDLDVYPFTASALASIATLPVLERRDLRRWLHQVALARRATSYGHGDLEMDSAASAQERRTAEILMNVLSLTDLDALVAQLREARSQADLVRSLDDYAEARFGSYKPRFARTLRIVTEVSKFVGASGPGKIITLFGSAANGGDRDKHSDVDLILDAKWSRVMRGIFAMKRGHFDMDRPLTSGGYALRGHFDHLSRQLDDEKLSVLDGADLEENESTFDDVPRGFGDLHPISFRTSDQMVRLVIYDLGTNRVHAFDITKLVDI